MQSPSCNGMAKSSNEERAAGTASVAKLPLLSPAYGSLSVWELGLAITMEHVLWTFASLLSVSCSRDRGDRGVYFPSDEAVNMVHIRAKDACPLRNILSQVCTRRRGRGGGGHRTGSMLTCDLMLPSPHAICTARGLARVIWTHRRRSGEGSGWGSD